MLDAGVRELELPLALRFNRGRLMVLPQSSRIQLDQHLSRSDSANWIAQVFADRVLAAEVRAIGHAWRDGSAPAVCDRIARTIRARYWSERLAAGA